MARSDRLSAFVWTLGWLIVAVVIASLVTAVQVAFFPIAPNPPCPQVPHEAEATSPSTDR